MVLHVEGRALEDALEGDGLLGLHEVALGQRLHLLVEVAQKLSLEGAEVGPAVAQQRGGARVVEQRQEHVLEGQVLVAPAGGLVHGAGQGDPQLICHLHTFTPARW